MDVVNPANMQNILDDTEHPFVPAINIPGYNIETIDTTLKANMSFPGSDYTGDVIIILLAGHLNLIHFQLAMTGLSESPAETVWPGGHPAAANL